MLLTNNKLCPQGNIFYVAQGGNDNVGDNMYASLLTVKQALARADASVQGPVTIYIYSGEYEEIFLGNCLQM